MFKRMYIGYKDSYGQKIKEGDILRIFYFDKEQLGVVKYNLDRAGFLIYLDYSFLEFESIFLNCWKYDIKVVGSVYDESKSIFDINEGE